ncbi:MAG: hypothetical protein VKP70_02500 [Cyanobacteriota bacterium]|nr:hypothetical protein [Cyanobacteriota bacterium]
MSGSPVNDQPLAALEGELRRGSLSQESLRAYLNCDLPVHVRIELEWMLYAIKQLEEHRERLVTRLSEAQR